MDEVRTWDLLMLGFKDVGRVCCGLCEKGDVRVYDDGYLSI